MRTTLTIGQRIRAAVIAGTTLPTLEGEAAHKLIVSEIEGQVCQCGRKKTANVAFCPKDLQKIPGAIYTMVWSSRGDALNAAYASCLGILHAPLIAKHAKRRAAR